MKPCPVAAFLLCGVIGMSLAGCGARSEPALPSGPAVVDLDEVARQLGRDREMADLIQRRQADLNRQLSDFEASLQQQLAANHSGPRESMSAEERARFDADAQRLGVQLRQAQAQLQNDLAAYRQQVIASFREEVKPYAQSVSRQRGLGVVLTKNEAVVFAFDDAADITGEVALAMRPTGSADRDQSSRDRIAGARDAATEERRF
jgi:Skp family chaperone for outer membrane proteins